MAKVKIEFTTEAGEKVTLSIEGRISRDRLSQILDLVEILGGVEGCRAVEDSERLTIMDKIVHVIRSRFRDCWFTSVDLVSAYAEVYGERLKIGTASTYLARLYSSGFLVRAGSRSSWRYRMAVASSAEERV